MPSVEPGPPGDVGSARTATAPALAGPTAVGRDAFAVALLAAVLSAAGSARPSLWFDEAATISAGSRSLPALWRMLGNIDAVHGLYYLLMHGWLAVFRPTEFWLRVPSCLAVGLACAGVVVLARRFSGRSVAVTAGLVFAILPRITWAGVEARSYAVSTAAAVWLTVLVVAAARRNRVGWWVGYVLALAATILLNLFTALIVVPHGVAVATCATRRSAVIRWSFGATVAILGLIPFAVTCRREIGQVGWISPLSSETLLDVVYVQYFDHSAPFAIAAGVLIALTVVLGRFRAPDDGTRQLTIIAVVWIVVPTAVLIGYSAASTPIYYPRYLCYTCPGAALLLAVCVVALVRTRGRVAAVLAVLAVAAAPNYLLKQRGPYAKEGMDFSQIADLVERKAAPGDCLVLDNTVRWRPGPIRPVTSARPDAYRKLVDPSRGMLAAQRDTLWDGHVPIWSVLDEVRRCTVIWTVSDRDPTLAQHDAGRRLTAGPRMRAAPAFQATDQLGFHIVERWQFSFAQVTKSTR